MTRQQFEEEVLSIRPRLLAIATRITGAGDAEDIVQDTMLKLWLMHDRLDDDFEALAVVTVRNLSLNNLRRLRPQESLAEADILYYDTPEASIDEERLERVYTIIGQLPEHQRQLLELRLTEGMDYNAIARRTGTKPSAVRQTVSRTYRFIRRQYRTFAAAVILLIGFTITLRLYNSYLLRQEYGGSYIVVNGQRIDNLRQIRSQIEQTLAQATTIEQAASETMLMDEATDNVLSNIDDPQERQRMRELLQ